MRTAIYARISQDAAGLELGVTRQEQDCRAEAKSRGWEVVGVYADNDVSATRSKSRPEYERMLRDVRSGHLQAVVVWDIDRLTRTPREIEDVIDFADEYGLALANVGGDIDLSTSDGRMMARIKGALARAETEKMGKRLQRRFLQKAELGEPHGRSPYGYRRVDGRDVPDEAEAAVVREAARRVLAGESLRSVCATFKEQEIPGPASPKWNSTILRQILVRPSNAGLRQYRGQIIGNSTADPILGVDTHERLVALLTDPSRKQNHAGPDPKYLLGGIARCGLCGGCMRRLVGRIQKLADGSTKRQPAAYGCSACFKVRRNQEAVDSLVESVVVARLSDPDVANALLVAGDPRGAREAQAALDAIDAKLAVAADQFTDDVLTAEQLRRITTRLRSERAIAERQLQAARPNDRLAAVATGDVLAKWRAAPVAVKREVIETLMTVTILPTGSGRRFDPKSVRIDWRS